MQAEYIFRAQGISEEKHQMGTHISTQGSKALDRLTNEPKSYANHPSNCTSLIPYL